MKINSINGKREDALELLGTLVLILGIIGVAAAFIIGAGNGVTNYFTIGCGIVGLILAYVFYAILCTLAENHCMLRKIVDDKKSEGKNN